MSLLPAGVGVKRFLSDLYREINDDQIFNGAAALAFFLTLALFPALIFLLSLLPFLPVERIDQAIMDILREALPSDAAGMVSNVVAEITSDKKGGLLSFGLLGVLWAASSGTYAMMLQLNNTYDVSEGRSFLRGRLTALGLTLGLGSLVVFAFLLIVMGGQAQDWLAQRLDWDRGIFAFFAGLRWVIIVAAILLVHEVAFYVGPNVKHDLRYISPGSVFGTVMLILASLGFQFYVSQFGNYDATYGSIGAVIVLMLWLYIGGLVFLVGSEINVLLDTYTPGVPGKGEVPEKVPRGRHQ